MSCEPLNINGITTERIKSKVEASKLSLAAIANITGISYSTLNRKTKGRGEWSATEVYLVARAIHVPMLDLLPPEVTGAHGLAVAV